MTDGYRRFTPNGLNLVALMTNPLTSWRTSLLIEHGKGWMGAPPDRGVRTLRYKYAELETGEKELYDLWVDRYEMVNQANNPSYAAVISQLQEHLRQRQSE